MLTPVYAVLVAPLVGLVIRQAVSRQREFLADADAALLTRDPGGLASALVKIGMSRGHLSVGEGSAHLYFADPYSETSLLHRVFPSHPPLEARIAMLARMGSGIEQSLAVAEKTPL
jgi:heat shock protein HtpX